MSGAASPRREAVISNSSSSNSGIGGGRDGIVKRQQRPPPSLPPFARTFDVVMRRGASRFSIAAQGCPQDGACLASLRCCSGRRTGHVVVGRVLLTDSNNNTGDRSAASAICGVFLSPPPPTQRVTTISLRGKYYYCLSLVLRPSRSRSFSFYPRRARNGSRTHRHNRPFHVCSAANGGV